MDVTFQILVHLCKHTSPAEELARKDDLSLLFSAITSWCPPHNAIWRKCAAEILMTLSRHGLSPNVVRYIHGKFGNTVGVWGVFCQLLYGLNFNCIENYTWEKSNIFQKILLNVCEVKRVNQDSK